MSVLPFGVSRVLKPVVSFGIGALSALMTGAIFYAIIFIAFADRLVPHLFGTN